MFFTNEFFHCHLSIEIYVQDAFCVNEDQIPLLLVENERGNLNLCDNQ